MSSLVIATSILNNAANKYLITSLNKRIFSSTVSILNSKIDNNYNNKKLFYSTRTNTAYNYEQNNKDATLADKENLEITSSTNNQNNDSTNWFPNKVLVNNDENNRDKTLTNESNKNINNKNTNNDPNKRPSIEQLIRVKEQLVEHVIQLLFIILKYIFLLNNNFKKLPKFLQKTHPYSRNLNLHDILNYEKRNLLSVIIFSLYT